MNQEKIKSRRGRERPILKKKRRQIATISFFTTHMMESSSHHKGRKRKVLMRKALQILLTLDQYYPNLAMSRAKCFALLL